MRELVRLYETSACDRRPNVVRGLMLMIVQICGPGTRLVELLPLKCTIVTVSVKTSD